MKVLKNMRRRKSGNMRIGIGSKKLLNYSTVSNGSGYTEDDDSEDLMEAFSPLAELTRDNPPEATPEPKLSLFHDNKKPLVDPNIKLKADKPAEPKPDIKRVPVEPIAPLGTVVDDESEWDSISHISVISKTSSTAKSPDGINLSADDLQEGVGAAVPTQNSAPITHQETAATEAAAVVSPGPEDKADSNVDDNISSEEEGEGHVRRMLKRFDDSSKDSKISHFFEDDQESTQISSNNNSNNTNSNLVIVHNVGTSPVYKEKIPMPVSVSPESNAPTEEVELPTGTNLIPAFEAVLPKQDDQTSESVGKVEQPHQVGVTLVPAFEAVLREKDLQNPQYRWEQPTTSVPDLSGAVAPSFDGSTATAFTNNTTSMKSGSGSTATTAATTVEASVGDGNDKDDCSVISDKIHKKLSTIEVTMRSACTGMKEMKPPELPEFERPNCDSIFSSTKELSENLKDSLQTIRKEISGAYSGISSATSEVVKIARQESQHFFKKDESKLDVSDDIHVYSQYLEEETLDELDELHTIQEESYASSGTGNMLNSSNDTDLSYLSGRKSQQSTNGNNYNERTATQASF